MAAKDDTKGKKDTKKKKKKAYHTYALYEISDSGVKRKNQSCPKCGPGTFMGLHKDRTSCGKCGYCEFKKKDK